MKFAIIKIPVGVRIEDPLVRAVEAMEESTLEVRMTVSDNATVKDVLERLAQKLDDKLNLVDLGDQD